MFFAAVLLIFSFLLLSSPFFAFAEGASSGYDHYYQRAYFLSHRPFPYDDLKEAGVKLTDEQMMFVFNYTQNGVEALESFREEREDNKLDSNESGVQREA